MKEDEVLGLFSTLTLSTRYLSQVSPFQISLVEQQCGCNIPKHIPAGQLNGVLI
jgi:hypothetical protein